MLKFDIAENNSCVLVKPKAQVCTQCSSIEEHYAANVATRLLWSNQRLISNNLMIKLSVLFHCILQDTPFLIMNHKTIKGMRGSRDRWCIHYSIKNTTLIFSTKINGDCLVERSPKIRHFNTKNKRWLLSEFGLRPTSDCSKGWDHQYYYCWISVAILSSKCCCLNAALSS